MSDGGGEVLHCGAEVDLKLSHEMRSRRRRRAFAVDLMLFLAGGDSARLLALEQGREYGEHVGRLGKRDVDVILRLLYHLVRIDPQVQRILCRHNR
jgi:hypothetical protein